MEADQPENQDDLFSLAAQFNKSILKLIKSTI
jgi:hypothetical protein